MFIFHYVNECWLISKVNILCDVYFTIFCVTCTVRHAKNDEGAARLSQPRCKLLGGDTPVYPVVTATVTTVVTPTPSLRHVTDTCLLYDIVHR